MPSSRRSSQPRDQTCLFHLLHWQVCPSPLAPPGKPRYLGCTCKRVHEYLCVEYFVLWRRYLMDIWNQKMMIFFHCIICVSSVSSAKWTICTPPHISGSTLGKSKQGHPSLRDWLKNIKKNVSRYICITESFCSIAEINTTLEINYPSIIPFLSYSGSGGSPGGRHGNPLQYSCL